MSIRAHNKIKLPLRIKDYYLWDPNRNVGYYGALEYTIIAGGDKTIPSSVFTDKLMEERRPQEIHVKSGEDTLLVLHHEDFENNKGNEVFFEMGNGGVLGARFVRGEEITIAQRIWGMLPFRGAGANIEAPVSRAGLTSTGALRAECGEILAAGLVDVTPS
ncbi:hypothetical protein Pfo_025107 [Paulownia fortunei]|nr:hypothetical protein Pfo_025107 [Paulownia fortunei]